MDCNEAHGQLPALLAGLLDDAAEAALREHLADCPGCAAGLPFAPAPHVHQRMAGQLEQLLARPQPPRRSPDRWAALLAAAAAVMLACVLWFPATSEPPPRVCVDTVGWVPPLAASRRTAPPLSLPQTLLLAARRGAAGDEAVP